MKFDSTINLGHLFTVVSLLLGGAYAYANIQVDLAELKIIAEGNMHQIDDHESRLRYVERQLMMPDHN